MPIIQADLIPTGKGICNSQINAIQLQKQDGEKQTSIKRYRHTNKPRKAQGPKTWRSRKDPFENVWQKIQLRLELNPGLTAKGLLEGIMKEQPEKFTFGQLRTLQRRVADWRKKQLQQAKNNQLMILPNEESTHNYLSTVMNAAN